MASSDFTNSDDIANQDALSGAKNAPKHPPQSGGKAPSVSATGGQATPPRTPPAKAPEAPSTPLETAPLAQEATASKIEDPAEAAKPRKVTACVATESRQMYVANAGLVSVEKGTVYRSLHHGPAFIQSLLRAGVAAEYND